MRIKTTLVFCLLAIFFSAKSQNITSDGNVIKVGPPPADAPFVTQMTAGNKSAKPSVGKRTTLWLETGDGFFTSNPYLSWPVVTSQSHAPLVHFSKTYDTTKFPPPTSIKAAKKSTVAADPSHSYSDLYEYILGAKKIRLLANNAEIVPGDPMVFTVVYNTLPIDTGIAVRTMDSLYRVYLFYNNNRTFIPLSAKNKAFTIEGSTENIPAARIHHGEAVSFNTGLNIAAIKQDYTDYLCFTTNEFLQQSKAVFVSLKPYADLQLGKSGSIYAVLTDSKGKILDTDIIPNMLYAPAHDPNYIVQRPYCLTLPKKEFPFEYKVHFQNTGAGSAVEVKTLIHLPKGMNWSTFKVTKATFAGADYTAAMKVGKEIILDSANSLITLRYFSNAIAGQTHLLRGTGDSTNVMLRDDPEELRTILQDNTTGEFLFTIKSTPSTEDKMEAYAEIYFKSQYPSTEAVGGYELPVKTNLATTQYKECCTCDEVKPIDPNTGSGCYKILGLCWWCWIIIILGIIILIYLLRKKKDSRNTPPDSQYNLN